MMSDLDKLDGMTLNAEFVAVEDCEVSEKVTRVTAYCVNTEGIPENTKFIPYYFFKKEIKCGDRFSAYVKLTSLEDNEYKALKFGNSVYMDCKIIKINEKYGENSFFAAVGKIRSYIKKTIGDNYSDEDTAVLTALNTGDRSLLSDEFYSKVLTCGVSHVMVVSGLHISIIIGSIFLLIEKFFYNRYLKALTSLLLIFLICAVCGFTLSVLRAGCMFLFSAISPVFLRRNDSFNSLGSSVLLLVFISPLCVLSVAFWLSVLSTAAVVWVAPFYSELFIQKLKIKNVVFKTLISILTVSVSAMLFTAPVSLTVFGYISLISPFAFLLLTYPVTFALTFNSSGLFLSSVGGLSFVSKPLFFVAGLCAKYIRNIIDNLGLLDFLCVYSNTGIFTIFVLLAAFLVLIMYLYKYRIKLLKEKYLSEVYVRANNNRKRVKRRAEQR
ncbi:MAG: ComEC/Rec2 family competence protein [Clostridia bacterium]|nr:ComEC/Rec2 family competence protein [Clostridia bacterium]